MVAGSIEQLISTDLLNMILFTQEVLVAEIMHVLEIIRSSKVMKPGKKKITLFQGEVSIIFLIMDFDMLKNIGVKERYFRKVQSQGEKRINLS